MRARLTLILTVTAAVLTALFGFAGFGVSGAAASSSPRPGGWFTNLTGMVEGPEVEPVVTARALQRADLASVAATLATTPPPLPPPPPPPPPPVGDPSTFLFPANGPITSNFGRRWGRAHTGVDIDGATGSPVVAAQSGSVVLAGWKNGYGNTVIVDHGNGVQTLYAHLSRIGVRTGAPVARGQFVGAVGATGNVTAAHLHYEVLVGGVPRNPGPWL